MSQEHDVQEIEKHVEAGRLLAKRLRVARETSGLIVCPACKLRFDATHVVKCPQCRTFIDNTFQAAPVGRRKNDRAQHKKRQQKFPNRKSRVSRKTPEKVELELDFFTQGYMEYKG